MLLPLLVAQGGVSIIFGEVEGGLEAFVVHLLEGLFRVAIFVGYLLLVSRSREIGRVFQYHGAEHMTIHALEADLPLTTENVRRYPTAHPRCGTEFLVIFNNEKVGFFVNHEADLIGKNAPQQAE